MKKFMICAIALFLLLSTSVFGDTPPGNVQSGTMGDDAD